MTVQRIGGTAVSSPLSTKGATAAGGAARLRPAAIPYRALVLALRNARGSTSPVDPQQFLLRLGRRGGTSKSYASRSTSVRAARLAPRSSMETTIAFVIPRFNPKGTRLSLEFRERGRQPLN